MVQGFHPVSTFDLYFVATPVAFWVFRIEFSTGMQWLVDVAQIVDDQSKRERPLVFRTREGFLQLLDINGAIYTWIPFQKLAQSVKSANDIGRILDEAGEVFNS